MSGYKQRLLCPECIRVPVEGTPFVQVKECGNCEVEKMKNVFIHASKSIKAMSSHEEVEPDDARPKVRLNRAGEAVAILSSDIKTPVASGKENRNLARLLGLSNLQKYPMGEWCRFRDEDGHICGQPIRAGLSRIPKGQSEAQNIEGVSLRLCGKHMKAVTAQYMKRYLAVYLPKYFETYPKEKRLESLKKSNSKRYGTPERKAYMSEYMKKWRKEKRERAKGLGSVESQASTLQQDTESPERRA